METECGLQAPPSALNVPLLHAPAHVASLVAVPATNGVPDEHVGVEWTTHAVLSKPDEYVEARQGAHTASRDPDPAVNPSPTGQSVTVYSVHPSVPTVAENFPAEHVLHVLSALRDPAVKPSPTAHVIAVRSVHAFASVCFENLPTSQSAQDESSARGEQKPQSKPLPGGQFWTAFGMQAFFPGRG